MRTRQPFPQEPPNPLPGYQILEISVPDGSPAAGRALGTITWPPGSCPVSILRGRTLQDPDPGTMLCPGDLLNLLTRAAQPSASRRLPAGRPEPQPHGQSQTPSPQ
ncbi:MAG: TrkA C-terminal domain-containing protein [Streptosporangiaceae bacterium]